MTTLKLLDRVTAKMGAMKGEKGTIRKEKRNESGYGDRYVMEFYVEWDSGGFGWQSPHNLERVEDK